MQSSEAVPGHPALRRPSTTDSSDFWYIAHATWRELIANLLDPAQKKNALQQLRKYDACGRIMETDEGETAANTCKQCAHRSLPCRVWKEKDDISCAFCKRNGRAGCEARVVPTAEPTITLANLENRLVILEAARTSGVIGSPNAPANTTANGRETRRIANQLAQHLADDTDEVSRRLERLESRFARVEESLEMANTQSSADFQRIEQELSVVHDFVASFKDEMNERWVEWLKGHYRPVWIYEPSRRLSTQTQDVIHERETPSEDE